MQACTQRLVLLEAGPGERGGWSRSAWVASAAIRMSIGLPIAKMPPKTITDVTKRTRRFVTGRG